jgi:ribonuclease-3
VKLTEIIKTGTYIDSKSRFQEISQERDGITPHYEVVSEAGPDHDKIFEIAVYLDKKKWGVGTGNSKQAGQQAAAAEALKKYLAKK